jgi:hypothetical protein
VKCNRANVSAEKCNVKSNQVLRQHIASRVLNEIEVSMQLEPHIFNRAMSFVVIIASD